MAASEQPWPEQLRTILQTAGAAGGGSACSTCMSDLHLGTLPIPGQVRARVLNNIGGNDRSSIHERQQQHAKHIADKSRRLPPPTRQPHSPHIRHKYNLPQHKKHKEGYMGGSTDKNEADTEPHRGRSTRSTDRHYFMGRGARNVERYAQHGFKNGQSK